MVRTISALLLVAACGSDRAGGGAPPDAPAGGSDASAIDAATSPLALACAATSATWAPNPCPTQIGVHGHAYFCFRPQWPGVTSVDVYGGFHGDATDWTQPFVSLVDDGTGTFTGSAALADGSYPYMFRVHGAADHLVRDGMYFNDQTNPSFVPSPPQAPVM